MIDPFSYWRRVYSSWQVIDSTGRRLAQTAQASGTVISYRTDTMRDAIRSPWSADYGELSRMVPEKLAAFSLSGTVVLQAWLEAQDAWCDQAQVVGRMMTRGKWATPGEMLDIWSRTALGGLHALESGSRTVRDALAPIHAAATGNAKRLNRKSAAKSRS